MKIVQMIFPATLLAAASSFFSTDAIAGDCQLKILASLPVSYSSNGDAMIPVNVEGRDIVMKFSPNSLVSLINQDVAIALGLHRTEINQNVVINYNGGQVKVRTTAKLKIGSISGDSDFGVPFSPVSSDPKMAGILAFDILKKMDIELDIAHGKINFFTQDHCPGAVVYWTRSAPVAAIPMEMRGSHNFLIPMTLDGTDIEVQLEPSIDRAFLSTGVAEREYGQPRTDDEDSLSQPYTFKSLGVEGIAIGNPKFYPYWDPDGGACSGKGQETSPELRNETNRRLIRCFGSLDAYLGRSQLKLLRIFLAFKEKMMYVTAANAE
ncbi:MAG: hypothetical protein GC166_06990 [Alphaproteobacteria bacterium]|nr:hypothetical protein [Alphaproteobacteria bacterium]